MLPYVPYLLRHLLLLLSQSQGFITLGWRESSSRLRYQASAEEEQQMKLQEKKQEKGPFKNGRCCCKIYRQAVVRLLGEKAASPAEIAGKNEALETRPPALERGLWWWNTSECTSNVVGMALLMGCSKSRYFGRWLDATSY